MIVQADYVIGLPNNSVSEKGLFMIDTVTGRVSRFMTGTDKQRGVYEFMAPVDTQEEWYASRREKKSTGAGNRE